MFKTAFLSKKRDKGRVKICKKYCYNLYFKCKIQYQIEKKRQKINKIKKLMLCGRLNFYLKQALEFSLMSTVSTGNICKCQNLDINLIYKELKVTLL